jgi:short-subunit dehydrogenase
LAELAGLYPGIESLVVNNAGFVTSGTFVDLPVDHLVNEVDLNVIALTCIAHAALVMMTERRRGWLRRVASLAPSPARTELFLGPDPLDRQIEFSDQRVAG